MAKIGKNQQAAVDPNALRRPESDEQFTFTPDQPPATIPGAHLQRDTREQRQQAAAASLPVLPDFNFAPFINEEETFDRSKVRNGHIIEELGADAILGSDPDIGLKDPPTHNTTRRSSSGEDGKDGSDGSATVVWKRSYSRIMSCLPFGAGKRSAKEEEERNTEPLRSRIGTAVVVGRFAAKVWTIRLARDLWDAIINAPYLIVKGFRWAGRMRFLDSFFPDIEDFIKTHRETTAILYLLLAGVINGLYGMWIYYVCEIYMDPHRFRDSILTHSTSRRNGFTKTIYFVGACLAVYNSCITLELFKLAGRFIERHQDFLFSNLDRLWSKRRLRAPPVQRTAPKEQPGFFVGAAIIIAAFLFFFFPILAPVIVASVMPSQMRKQTWKNSCPEAEWDYSVTLNARYQMAKDWGKAQLTIYDRHNNNAWAHFVTKDWVASDETQNEQTIVLLPNGTSPEFQPQPDIKQVVYHLPYARTPDEKNGWPSNSDILRQTYGNYTVTLSNGTDLVGQFPYLNDRDGLRMPEFGLIPDIARSYRAKAYKDCLDGADALLYENPDVNSRALPPSSPKHIVLKTGLNKYLHCAQKVVCANRRKGVLSGSQWADGEEGKKLLDRLLVVPMGILLVEQVSFSSCCQDGWPASTSSSA